MFKPKQYKVHKYKLAKKLFQVLMSECLGNEIPLSFRIEREGKKKYYIFDTIDCVPQRNVFDIVRGKLDIDIPEIIEEPEEETELAVEVYKKLREVIIEMQSRYDLQTDLIEELSTKFDATFNEVYFLIGTTGLKVPKKYNSLQEWKDSGTWPTKAKYE